MNTNKMNERITFFKKKFSKDKETGEKIEVREDLFSCWAEIPKSKIKEFRERSTASFEATKPKMRKDTTVFLIRYQQRLEVDTTMFIDFRGQEFSVVDIEIDYANKDFNLISGVKVE